MPKRVYLIPGFLASNLAIRETGQQIWWEPTIASALGLGAMRLAPNGIDPGAPDGKPMALTLPAQDPWPAIKGQLDFQLDPSKWTVEVDSYDWRRDLLTTAENFATLVRSSSTAENPGTLVGHSAGGLVALLVWASLVKSGETALIRRIITICSPIQGSYEPINWLTGTLPGVQQLLALFPLVSRAALPVPVYWTLDYLNALVLTWPAFYELYPGLLGFDATVDINRPSLYVPGNYPPRIRPSPAWLTYARTVFQPALFDSSAFPPDYVLTCVASMGLVTAFELLSTDSPLDLTNLGTTPFGDGIVNTTSQIRAPGKVVRVTGGHASVPIGLAVNGVLADLIRDPRGPLSPPPLPLIVDKPLPIDVTDPPQSAEWNGYCAIGGG